MVYLQPNDLQKPNCYAYIEAISSLAQTLKLQISEKDYLMGGFYWTKCSCGRNNHPNVLARYINDNFDKSQINVVFRKIERDACALVYSLRLLNLARNCMLAMANLIGVEEVPV